MEHRDPDWSEISKHLLDKILEKLNSAVDILQFRTVCNAWNYVAKDNYPKLKTVPMLLIPPQDDSKCNVYDIIDHKFLSSKLSIPYKKRFAGSSRGWLVAVHEDWTVSLYKPFSRVVDPCIRLPSLFPPEQFDDEPKIISEGDNDMWTDQDYHIKKVLITADPLENPKECLVFAIYGDFCCEDLAFIRPGDKDSTWTRVSTKDEEIYAVVDIVQYGNQHLYIAGCDGQFHSFDLSDPYNSNLTSIAPIVSSNSPAFNRYIVESCHGRFYKIDRYFEFREDLDRLTTGFAVHALDCDIGEWIEVRSLKDETLFLGENSSISIKATDFFGCEKNSIYFTHDQDIRTAWNIPIYSNVGIYNIETKEFKMHFTIDPSTLTKTNIRPPIWIVPTLDV